MKKQLKQYKTIEEQIEILKERGCIISDVSSARETLSKINYYRLTAYLLPFRDKESIEKKYVKNTTFEKIFALHEFDRKLRSLILQALDYIEITLRERLARAHVENHNHDPIAYLNMENFEFKDTIGEKGEKDRKVRTKRENEQYFLKTISYKISQNKRNCLIKQLDEEVTKKLEQGVNDCKELKLPFWVIVEFLSFGELSRLYTNLQEDDRNKIAEQFIPEYISGKTRREYLENWFHCCSNLRNRCAHLGVLYHNNSFTPTPKGFKNTNISNESLWAFILVIKWLHPYSDEWHEEFISQIKILMDKYSKDIDLEYFSFPDKWEEELGKSQKSSLEENVKRYILNRNKRYKKKKLDKKHI
ncbi:MAG: Abi family protein [Acetobacter sp.]|nr:Abi family protein [Acetobacter sp.]